MEATVLEKKDVVETGEVRISMTKEQFLQWNPDEGFLYEYDNGFAVQATGMKKKERYIIRNIQKAFRKTSAFAEDAYLYEENDVWVTESQKRILDMAFFTDAQIKESLNDDVEPIPSFVVELISPGDKSDKIETKIIEYFTAGVQVVWHVHPALRMIRVFTSVRSAASYFEDDAFSADPAVPGLEMTVSQLFAL
ncbi:Uma2 family endonuclease [Spirosoma arcticum]